MMMTPQEQVAFIDRRIDVVQRALVRRVGHFNTNSAGGWQRAWDRNPRLRLIEKQLFSDRYDAQRASDDLEAKAFRKAQLAEQRAYRKAARVIA